MVYIATKPAQCPLEKKQMEDEIRCLLHVGETLIPAHIPGRPR